MVTSSLALQPGTSWSDTWYPNTIQSLTAIAGAGNDDSSGNPMPNLSAIDTIGVLGLITPSVASAIDRINTLTGGQPGKPATRSDNVAADGTQATSVWIGGAPDGLYIDAATYLTYSPDPTFSGQVSATNYKRWPVETILPSTGTDDTIQSYEFYCSEETYLEFVRTLIDDWQRAVNASAACISIAAANTTQPADPGTLDEFLRAIAAVCSDLDTLAENPPTSGNITDALHYALSKSAEFVGKSAAQVAGEVGKDVGNVGANLLGGFLDNAGIISIIVVGLVVRFYVLK